MRKHKFDIVRNELIPKHEATVARFDFAQSLPLLQKNTTYEISPEKERRNIIRYGSHASVGYSACSTPAVGTASEANRIFQNIINSDMI